MAKKEFSLLLLVMAASGAFGAGLKASQPSVSGPIVITRGGTYSGIWRSDDPKVAAVTIRTDDPVVIRDAKVISRGDLISITGVKTGANVTVENVTGTALDPQVSGKARGSFIKANKVAS
ncbi:MAG: hypothetical protein P4L40_02205, partial [Terracidiphilus sp.]|nr:hypothetical protein [Terracidiphilus sp.]